jgi:hypothetical protein
MYFRKAADLHTISDRNIYDFPCFIWRALLLLQNITATFYHNIGFTL